MKTIYRNLTFTITLALMALVFAPAATPCAYSPLTAGSYTIQQLSLSPHNPLDAASPEAVLRDLKATGATAPSIVGMWNIQFMSRGNTSHNPPIPDGAVIDFGYGQWHSDNLEFYNSGGRSPITQNYCQGVWTSTGTYTYQLNHFAITYDSTGTYNGKANITENITLSTGGTRYSGTFTITQYNTNGVQVDQVFGQLTATRITVDTTTP